MRNQNVNIAWRKPRAGVFSILGLGLTLFLASTIAGLLAVVLPWFIIVPIVLVSASFVLAFAYPEFAAAALLAAMFGVFPSFILPNIPVAGGSVRPEDIGIAIFLLILMMRHAGTIGQRLATLKPYAWPICAILLSALVSIIYSFFIGKVPLKDIFNEARAYYVWLFLPLLPLAIDSAERMRRFGFLLLCLALLLAVGGMFQAVTGIHVFQRDQLMSLTTVDETFGGIARSASPGGVFMAAVFIYICAALTMRSKASVVGSFVVGTILLGGIVVGFTRSLWVSVIIGLILLAVYARHGRYLVLIGALLMAGFGALATLAVANPTYLDAVTGRLLTLNDEIKTGTSFGRRKVELDYAIPKVMKNPLVGVGMGGKYKPHTLDAFGWEGETRYIHNLYAAAATKMGVPGLLAMLWLVGVLLWRSWRLVSQRKGDRAVVFACWWVLLTSTIFTTATQPVLASSFGIATAALAIFMMERAAQRTDMADLYDPVKNSALSARRTGVGLERKRVVV